MRIGAVNYLNTKPLIYGLAGAGSDIDLSLDFPSRLADQLTAGDLDVALIPSIEFLSSPDLVVVSDACIGCRGPVWSVKLFFRRVPATVRSLAVDEGSRTSGVLAQILLAQLYGIRPSMETLPLGMRAADCDADCVLVIGDRAMHQTDDGFVEAWDLGDRWCRWAELPFVFAMWVARQGVDHSRLAYLLSATRDRGVASIPEIANEHAAAMRLTPSQVISYLQENLYFRLGPRERKGLSLFYQGAADLGLAPAGREKTWDDRAFANSRNS